MSIINPRSIWYRAKGNGTADDSAAIQRAFDAGMSTGQPVRFTSGMYRVRKTLNLDSWSSFDISAEPGTVLLFDPLDATQTALLRITGGVTPQYEGQRCIRGLMLKGPKKFNPDSIGVNVGLMLDNAHQIDVENVYASGFDRAGVLVKDSYYCNFKSLRTRRNGYGVECAGSDGSGANATHFYGLHAQWNLYGAKDVQSVIGGSCEGNARSGFVYSVHGMRCSIHDCWIESNNTANVEGEADVLGLPIETHKAVGLNISGSTVFIAAYSLKNRKVRTHNISGCFLLSLHGITRFFEDASGYGNLNVSGRIVDCTSNTALKDIPGAWARKIEEYLRPGVEGRN